MNAHGNVHQTTVCQMKWCSDNRWAHHRGQEEKVESWRVAGQKSHEKDGYEGGAENEQPM